ncbi:hypothetical protein BJX76DRAFT_361716 [Aspergillus varians]
MAPSTSSWTSLALISFTIFFSTLTTSLPLPCNDLSPSKTGRVEIQPRSPIPEARMIPNETDLIATIFAKLGMSELSKFNKLDQGKNEGSASIDDSHSDAPTVTSQDNFNQTVSVQGQGKGKDVGTELSGGQAAVGGDAAVGGEDTDGFVDTLFEVLRRKFREALNKSDEVTLL